MELNRLPKTVFHKFLSMSNLRAYCNQSQFIQPYSPLHSCINGNNIFLKYFSQHILKSGNAISSFVSGAKLVALERPKLHQNSITDFLPIAVRELLCRWLRKILISLHNVDSIYQGKYEIVFKNMDRLLIKYFKRIFILMCCASFLHFYSILTIHKLLESSIAIHHHRHMPGRLPSQQKSRYQSEGAITFMLFSITNFQRLWTLRIF
jgi:hypothetical protein